MSKLYIFGIGGTGCRVLKSLTMLLAAGVKCDADTIIPIIIDRDMANADLTKTKSIIDNYIKLNDKAPKANAQNKNRFFNTPMVLLNGRLCMQLKDGAQVFKDYIQRDEMSRSNMALTDALFSKDAQSMNMTVGFQGVPNIGSVVLNQFEDAPIFQSFAQNFASGDKIFIISSIFGGTGASGFPLLLKTLRMQNASLNNWSLVNKAAIGAISVMPYFEVSKTEDTESRVKSDTFVDKAKAALSYYKTLDKELEVLYYIADNKKTTYEHHKGGSEQANPAHFVEMAAAMSILDFANAPITRDVNNPQTSYKEFGIKPSKMISASGVETINECNEMSFADMADETNSLIKKPMSQLFLFRKYLREVFPDQNTHQPWSHNYPWKKDKNFDDVFMKSEVMVTLNEFLDTYYQWLDEMKSKQARQFHPFSFDVRKTDALEFVRDTSSSRSHRYKRWAWMDNELNKQSNKISKTLSKNEAFIELFYRATESFVNTLI
jgi:hypothetical protein